MKDKLTLYIGSDFLEMYSNTKKGDFSGAYFELIRDDKSTIVELDKHTLDLLKQVINKQ